MPLILTSGTSRKWTSTFSCPSRDSPPLVPSAHAHAPAPSAQRTPGCPALPGRVAHSCPAPPAMLLCCTSLPCLAWYGRWGCLPHTPYPCPMPCPLPLLIPLPSSAQPSTPAPQHSALGAAVARRPPSPGKRGTLPHSPEPRLRRDGTPPRTSNGASAPDYQKCAQTFRPML